MQATQTDTDHLDLADVSHTLKGLCGLFRLVEGGLPDDQDIRRVFAEGIDRMDAVISKIDSHTSQRIT